MKAPNPNDLVKSCLALLQLRGIFAFRNNTGALQAAGGRYVRFGVPGSGDIIAILPGGVFASIECKTGRGRLSPVQRAFAAAVEQAGGRAVCVWSVGELEAWLRENGVQS